jgi:hypothetical protein
MIGIYAQVDIQKVDQIILFASEKDNCPRFLSAPFLMIGINADH